jgi:glycosyltransferase involved in cell wall biosynthesis
MIAFVAALEPRKRHAEFLDVFAGSRRTSPRAHALPVRQGPEEDRLRALVQ